MELMDLGGPPSMDSDKVWSAATNSTEWKLPSFTVSTLGKKKKGRRNSDNKFYVKLPLKGLLDMSFSKNLYIAEGG